MVAAEGLPLGLGAEEGARDLGHLQPHFDQDHHPPGDHQVQGQAGLQAEGIGQAAVLEATAAFENAVKDLNLPARGIPLESFAGVLPGRGLDGGEQ